MKRTKRSILSVVLALVLALSTAVVPAFAAETDSTTSTSIETTSSDVTRAAGEVYNMYDPHYAHYTITNNNTTPYKVMGASGTINIVGRFKKADSASYSNVRLLIQIRDYNTGAVLAQVEPSNASYPDWDTIVINADVYAGQKIYFFFDVSSVNNPPGPYRMAEVEYEAWLSEA